MNSFNDPLFSQEYFKPAPVEQTYLMASNGQSIFDNSILPRAEEINSDANIKDFLQCERGKIFLTFKDQLVQALSDWAKKHEVEINDSTFVIFNGYFNPEGKLGTKIINLYRQGIPYLEALIKAISNDNIPLYLRKAIVTDLISSGLQVCEEGIADNTQTAFQELTTDVANRLMTLRRKIGSAVIKEYLYTNYPYFMQQEGMEIHVIKYFLEQFNDILCLTLTGDHYTIDKMLSDNNQIKTDLRQLLVRALSSWKILHQIADTLDIDNQLTTLYNHINQSNTQEIEQDITRIMSALSLYGIDPHFNRYNLLEYNDAYEVIGVAKFAKQAIILSLQQRLISKGLFTNQNMRMIALEKHPSSLTLENSEEAPEAEIDMVVEDQINEWLYAASEADKDESEEAMIESEINFSNQFFAGQEFQSSKKQAEFYIHEQIGSEIVPYSHLFSHGHVFDPAANLRMSFLAYFYQEVLVEGNTELEQAILRAIRDQIRCDLKHVITLFTIMKFFHEFYIKHPQFQIKFHLSGMHELALTETLDSFANGSDAFDIYLQTLKAIAYYLTSVPEEYIHEIMGQLNKILSDNQAYIFDVRTIPFQDINVLNRFGRFLLNCQEPEVKILSLLFNRLLNSLEGPYLNVIHTAINKDTVYSNSTLKKIKMVYDLQKCFFRKEIITFSFYQVMTDNLARKCYVKPKPNCTPQEIRDRTIKAKNYFYFLKLLARYFGSQFAINIVQATNPSILAALFRNVFTNTMTTKSFLSIFPKDLTQLMLTVVERINPHFFDVLWFYYNLKDVLKHLYQHPDKFPEIIKIIPGVDGHLYMKRYIEAFNAVSNNPDGLNYKKFLIQTTFNRMIITDECLSSDHFVNCITNLPESVASEIKLRIENDQVFRVYFEAVAKIHQATNQADKDRIFYFAKTVLQPLTFHSIEDFLNIKLFLNQKIHDIAIEITDALFDERLKLFVSIVQTTESAESSVELIRQFFKNFVKVPLVNIDLILKIADSLSKNLNIDLSDIIVDKLLNNFSDPNNAYYIHTGNNLLHLLEKLESKTAMKWIIAYEGIFLRTCNTEKRVTSFLGIIRHHANKTNQEQWFANFETKLRNNLSPAPGSQAMPTHAYATQTHGTLYKRKTDEGPKSDSDRIEPEKRHKME